MNTPSFRLLVTLGVYIACGAALSAQSTGKDPTASKAVKRAELLLESSVLSERARTAQGEEARSLRRQAASKWLTAELLSEAATDPAAQQMAREVLDDPAQSAAAKLEIERLQGRLGQKHTRFASRSDWLKARSVQALDLIQRYPDQPGAYEELLAVAVASPREHAIGIAQQLSEGAAPQSVKKAAATILRRETIAGQHIATVVGGTAGSGSFLRRLHGKTTIIYSWSPTDEGSLKRAKQIGKAAPQDAWVIGVNLSRDVAAALACAKSEKLPGEQLYDARGFDSPLVEKLAMTSSSLVYAISREGVLENLSGEQDLGASIEKLVKGER